MMFCQLCNLLKHPRGVGHLPRSLCNCSVMSPDISVFIKLPRDTSMYATSVGDHWFNELANTKDSEIMRWRTGRS